MTRLIDIQPADGDRPGELEVEVGDLLRFWATGGVVAGQAVELLGVYTSSVVGVHGGIVTPAGPPDAVLVRAVAPGRAVVEIVSGDPWGTRARNRVTVVVS